MARSTPDMLCAQLLLDFLAWADSITAGVPDATTLPKLLMDAGKTSPLPVLIVNASETAETNGARRTITVGVLLHGILQNADANAPTDAASLSRTITRSTASGYMDLIERRLRDRTALSDFIATLADDRRQGFSIMSHRILRQPNIERPKDAPSGAFTLAVAVEFVLAWAM